jgi:BirA family biotin operon repressor/biotin-[acetyl-CoA-carboxylase] ligase
MTGVSREANDPSTLMNFTVHRFDSVDSTNTQALKHARRGADEGTCIVAHQQTAGRGRQGRIWASPPDAGLYLSIVLRPRLDAKHLPLITLAAAVAVFDTLAQLGVDADIKWPNDILVNEKKICGLLAEMTDTERGLAVIVGVGINLASQNFPCELVDTATSLESVLLRPVAFSEIEEPLLKFFDHWYRRLHEAEGASTIVREWASRSTYFRGKQVRVTLTSETIIGVTDGLGPNGALRVRGDNGELVIVNAGDVERVRSADKIRTGQID